MHSSTHDVVVIGGGIIGLACAYSLAADGVGVLLIEKGLPGSEQTVRTGGGIRLCHSSIINIQLSKVSFPIWEQFEDRYGVDPQFRMTGHLFLARSGTYLEVLGNQSRLHGELDIPSEVLTIDSISTRWPDVTLDGFRGGLLCPVGGYLNHYRAVQGFYHGALDAGARLSLGVRVTGFFRSGERIIGVETTDGACSADTVVNAAGALAGQIAHLAGLELPIISRRHDLLVVQPQRPVPEALPWLIDIDGQVHMRPDGQGRGLVGGFLGEDPVVDPERYDPLYDESWASRVRIAASEAFGLIEPDTDIVQGWAGIYAGTPDYHPVIEQSCQGLITAAGFSGTGLMHAPAVGLAVSELARTGEATSLDISGLRSSRFRGQVETRDSSGF